METFIQAAFTALLADRKLVFCLLFSPMSDAGEVDFTMTIQTWSVEETHEIWEILFLQFHPAWYIECGEKKHPMTMLNFTNLPPDEGFVGKFEFHFLLQTAA